MQLTGYGVREWGTALGIFAAATGIVLFLEPPFAVTLSILIPLGVVFLAILWFFRDPSRQRPTDWQHDQFISPADGVISAIEHHEQHADLGEPAVVIRIFLSVLDVHVNRFPCDGLVISSTHVPGQHHDARSDQCHRMNEHQLTMLRRDDGTMVGTRQIAGLIARRIVCHAEPEARAKAGERFGMIKFGSSTELILPRPDAVDVQVTTGQRVRGGATRLAQLSTVTE